MGNTYTHCMFKYISLTTFIKPHCENGKISTLTHAGLSPYNEIDHGKDSHDIDFCGDNSSFPVVSKCTRLLNTPKLFTDFNNFCFG